ncbi:MAG: UDP-N-acetylpyruvoylglucosamine reductase [Candidatus Saccharibacteria bacterium]|nr:UDP-N-acetylpyruvoylglucosamine reductase [Candidatus Saccharibacteria bacterium]
MNILHDVALSDYSTMGLGGRAAHLITIESRMDLLEALSWAQAQSVPVVMIGGGSNIIWRDEGFPGLVIVNHIQRYETFKEDDENIYITAGSGENWDTVVERAAQAGLTGIEALSLIPGTTGATLVQNIGAYGQEISGSLVTAEVFDTKIGDFITMRASDCGFGYRTSRFKTVDRGRFYITAITLHLTKGQIQPPLYASLAAYVKEHSITDLSPVNVRQAVIAIRNSRLPDPAIVHNTGSFFANPIISANELIDLRSLHPDIPSWPLNNDRVKLPAAWLIDKAGFKDYHDAATGMATWAAQPLVLVNEKAKTTADLLAFKARIVSEVHDHFGITLEQEPELFPLA